MWIVSAALVYRDNVASVSWWRKPSVLWSHLPVVSSWTARCVWAPRTFAAASNVAPMYRSGDSLWIGCFRPGLGFPPPSRMGLLLWPCTTTISSSGVVLGVEMSSFGLSVGSPGRQAARPGRECTSALAIFCMKGHGHLIRCGYCVAHSCLWVQCAPLNVAVQCSGGCLARKSHGAERVGAVLQEMLLLKCGCWC